MGSSGIFSGEACPMPGMPCLWVFVPSTRAITFAPRLQCTVLTRGSLDSGHAQRPRRLHKRSSRLSHRNQAKSEHRPSSAGSSASCEDACVRGRGSPSAAQDENAGSWKGRAGTRGIACAHFLADRAWHAKEHSRRGVAPRCALLLTKCGTLVLTGLPCLSCRQNAWR